MATQQQMESATDEAGNGLPGDAPKIDGTRPLEALAKRNRSLLSFRNIRSSFGQQLKFGSKTKQSLEEGLPGRRPLTNGRSSTPGSTRVALPGPFLTGNESLNGSRKIEGEASGDADARLRASEHEGAYELDVLASASGSSSSPQWKYLGDDFYIQTDATFEPAILNMWKGEIREQMRAFILNKNKTSSSKAASLKGKSAQLELVMAAAPMRSGGARPTIVMSGPKTAVHEYRKFLDEMVEMELIPRELFATHVYGKDVVG